MAYWFSTSYKSKKKVKKRENSLPKISSSQKEERLHRLFTNASSRKSIARHSGLAVDLWKTKCHNEMLMHRKRMESTYPVSTLHQAFGSSKNYSWTNSQVDTRILYQHRALGKNHSDTKFPTAPQLHVGNRFPRNFASRVMRQLTRSV